MAEIRYKKRCYLYCTYCTVYGCQHALTDHTPKAGNLTTISILPNCIKKSERQYSTFLSLVSYSFKLLLCPNRWSCVASKCVCQSRPYRVRLRREILHISQRWIHVVAQPSKLFLVCSLSPSTLIRARVFISSNKPSPIFGKVGNELCSAHPPSSSQ